MMEYQFCAVRGVDHAYGDYGTVHEALADFNERFPGWDCLCLWDEDMCCWMEVKAR